MAARLAKELESAGYVVVTAPTSDDVPFSLGGYIPDLVATKPDDKLIIEIKRPSPPGQVQPFRNVVEAVEAHPGWRFLIQTITDVREPDLMPTRTLTDVATIEGYLRKASRIMAMGAPELSFPYIWNAIVGLLRVQASREGIPHAELSDRSLINQLYTLGVISHPDLELLLQWSQLRNEAIHSMTPEIDDQAAKEAERFALRLAETLKTSHSGPESDPSPGAW